MIALVASTVSGVDYSAMYGPAKDELLALLPPLVAVCVPIFVAMWALQIAQHIFHEFTDDRLQSDYIEMESTGTWLETGYTREELDDYMDGLD